MQFESALLALIKEGESAESFVLFFPQHVWLSLQEVRDLVAELSAFSISVHLKENRPSVGFLWVCMAAFLFRFRVDLATPLSICQKEFSRGNCAQDGVWHVC